MGQYLDIKDNYFVNQYITRLARRFWSFNITLNLFLQLSGQQIVETGCIRLEGDWPAGYSTYLFAEFVSKFGGRFDSCDISEKSLDVARKVCEPFQKFVRFHKEDSLVFLEKWSKPIDLLYLDSVDCDPGSEEISKKAQEHQLKEIKLAYPNLTGNAIVLLDDNYFKNGGKTRLAKKWLAENNFVNLMDYEQSLWIRAK